MWLPMVMVFPPYLQHQGQKNWGLLSYFTCLCLRAGGLWILCIPILLPDSLSPQGWKWMSWALLPMPYATVPKDSDPLAHRTHQEDILELACFGICTRMVVTEALRFYVEGLEEILSSIFDPGLFQVPLVLMSGINWLCHNSWHQVLFPVT